MSDKFSRGIYVLGRKTVGKEHTFLSLVTIRLPASFIVNACAARNLHFHAITPPHPLNDATWGVIGGLKVR